jgi:preprotein translocase subunit SecY
MRPSTDKFADLRRRLLFLVLALVVYRLGTHIPVPGIDPNELAALFKSQAGGILGMFNMFSGGALSRFTVFVKSLSTRVMPPWCLPLFRPLVFL